MALSSRQVQAFPESLQEMVKSQEVLWTLLAVTQVRD
jgi:hypothetical protein